MIEPSGVMYRYFAAAVGKGRQVRRNIFHITYIENIIISVYPSRPVKIDVSIPPDTAIAAAALRGTRLRVLFSRASCLHHGPGPLAGGCSAQRERNFLVTFVEVGLYCCRI